MLVFKEQFEQKKLNKLKNKNEEKIEIFIETFDNKKIPIKVRASDNINRVTHLASKHSGIPNGKSGGFIHRD